MIKIVVKKYIREGKVEQAIDLYEQLVEASRKEEGCIAYNLYQDEEDKNILFIIEEWENKEVLEKHNESEHFT